jgi:flavin-dependent dehydrogenase
MDEYQVVIVGSGPAGAACGRALNEKGINALIVEKEALPRHKVCTGLVLGQAQELIKEYFGEAPPREVCSEPFTFKASNIIEWQSEREIPQFTLELPKDGRCFSKEYLNVWRSKFDYWLLKKSGAEFKDNCALKDLSEENGKYKVRLSDKSKRDKHVYCSYIVAADGADSRVRRLLEPSSVEETPQILGYHAFYRIDNMGSLQEDLCYAFRDRKFGDIMAFVLRKDEYLDLCLAGLKGCDLKKCMENLKAFLGEQFQVVFGDMEKAKGCSGKMKPPYLGKNRILLAGDAAGLIYLNGEGICTAIDSGYKAGKAICRSIKDGKNALVEYENETKPIINHMQVCFAQNRFFVE